MKIIRLEEKEQFDIAPSVGTIGFFDGLHLGHQYLIRKVIAEASKAQLDTTIVTFDRHPLEVICPERCPRLLFTLNEKIERLSQMGVKNVVVLPFNKALAALTAQDFMTTILKAQLHIEKLIIGYDNRFGKDRLDRLEDYVEAGKKADIEVIQNNAFEIKNIKVSSSVIRAYIEKGDLAQANFCLNRPYSLHGTVVAGYQNGHKLGFPTANIKPLNMHKILPPAGVYAVNVRLETNSLPLNGMLNIGMRPTFNGQEESIEVHIFDFEDDLYGKVIEIIFFNRIRDEKKFASHDDLAAQLRYDKKQIIDFFQPNKHKK